MGGYHALWDTSASGNNGSIVNELIGSKLENEEYADERRDAVRDNLAVDHVALKLWTCELSWKRRKELRCKRRGLTVEVTPTLVTQPACRVSSAIITIIMPNSNAFLPSHRL